jgi:hypothetical protein
MKKILAIALLLATGAVYAAAAFGNFDIWSEENKASKKRALVMNVPLYIGPHLGADAVQKVSTNRVTRILGAAYTIDFATATITCNDSAGQTLTGAKVGDTCIVGPPAAAQANASFTCRVSATDTVIVRYCAAGTAADPASASYAVTVISNQ